MAYLKNILKEHNIRVDSLDHAYDFTEWSPRAYIVYLITTLPLALVVHSDKSIGCFQLVTQHVLHETSDWSLLQFLAIGPTHTSVSNVDRVPTALS